MSSVNVTLKSVFDDKGIKQAEKAFGSVGSKISKFAGTLGVALGGAAIVNFAGDALKAAESAQVANNRLDQIASSMGIFGSQTGQVTDRLKAFADQQMMVIGQDDELIKSTQAKLLTFKELAATADTTGGAFDRATVAAFDLAAAGFGSAESNAVALGKALQDPVKGITALRKAGVTFTDAQKEQIKTLVESNDILRAQDIVLSAIEQQVGGTAAATVTSTQKIGLIFGELAETAGSALLPAAEQVATVLQTQLVPIIEQLGDYLQSAEGTQAVNNFGQAIANTTQFLVDSAKWLGENWNWVSKLGGAVLIAVGTLTALKTALELAKTAQLLFNIAVGANPYVFAAQVIVLGIMAIAGAIANITGEADNSKVALDQSVTSAFNLNNADTSSLESRLNNLETSAYGVANGLNAAANAVIPASPTTMNFPENPKPGQVYTWFNLGENDQAVWWQQTWTGTEWTKPKKMTYTPPGSNKPSKPAETTADRFKKVQAVIKRAQTAIAQAERDYGRVIFEINRDNNEQVRMLNEDALKSQEQLVIESKARITDAFKSATRLSLGDLFKSETTRQLETQVKQLTSRLTVSVTKETEKTAYSSVTDIINGLRDRISASKTLLANASKLAGLGFKQTFIEQVFETGTETGNALSSAILDAGPDTQRELRDLFGELETVSETGAGSLAKSIYDKFGLATREMKKQSVDIQTELDAALLKQSETLTRSLADAAYAFQVQIADIKTQFLADLDEFDGKFAGLGNTIKAVLANLAKLTGAATGDIQAALTAPGSGSVLAGGTVTNNVAIKDIKAATGLVIDELSDVKGAAAYLQARINAAQTYIKSSSSNAAQEMAAATSIADWTKQLSNLQGLASTGEAAGTVININVRTDTTQSQAMVGKTIGNIVTKYVTTGGQVLVSGS